MKKELRSVGRSGLVRLRSNRTTSGLLRDPVVCRVTLIYSRVECLCQEEVEKRPVAADLYWTMQQQQYCGWEKRRIGAEEEPERTNHFLLFPFDGTSRFGSGSAAESPSILRLPQLNWVGRQQDLLQYSSTFRPFFIFIFPSWGWWRKKKQRPGSVSSTPV